VKRNIKKKIMPEYFQAVVDGLKTFEIRKDEDGVQAGDRLQLMEYDGERWTGRVCLCDVKYVLRDCPQFGLMPGYCIIGF